MPSLINRVPTIFHLRKLSHRVDMDRRHLAREQLLDAVSRLDRLGDVHRDVQAAGVVRLEFGQPFFWDCTLP
jgi:hypothetical protein